MEDLTKRIEEAYLYDQEHHAHPVTSRDELPIAYEWITPEWLTDVLCKGVPGAKVLDFKFGNADSGTSNRQKITVTYNDVGTNAPQLPKKLFCKAAHNLANRIVVGGIGCAGSETNFYKHIRPHLNIEAPTCYFGKVDPKTWNAMIILGDLSDSVTEFCDHRTVMTKERAESQLRALAILHGQCYSRPHLVQAVKEHFIPWRQFFENTNIFGMQDASEAGFRMCEDLFPATLYARADEIWPGTVKSFDLHDLTPQTLAHHDVHLKNWYVAGNGEMGLGDWQCAVRGHWGRDFAYTMSCALTIEDRRAWERDLLGFYLDRLAMEGGPKIDFAEAWLRYRQQLITALTWWTITINPAPDMPDMQPRDTTREFLRRIGTAMDDVGTMDALKD